MAISGRPPVSTAASSCAAPRRTPPAKVATSAAPVTSRPGRVPFRPRPPARTRSVMRPGRRMASAEPQLEGHVRAEVADAQPLGGGARRASTGRSAGDVDVVGHVAQGGQGRQSDELGFAELDALVGGQAAHRLPHQPERRDAEVEQVHRHLGAAQLLQREAQGLDTRQAAGALADPPRDPLGQVHVGRGQVDVVGDEERPGAHGDGAAGRMERGGPKSGSRPCWAMSSRRPSNCGRRRSARTTRSGRVAARAYR